MAGPIVRHGGKGRLPSVKSAQLRFYTISLCLSQVAGGVEVVGTTVFHADWDCGLPFLSAPRPAPPGPPLHPLPNHPHRCTCETGQINRTLERVSGQGKRTFAHRRSVLIGTRERFCGTPFRHPI